MVKVRAGWGKPVLMAIKYVDILKFDGLAFTNYIWPVRQAEYDKNPESFRQAYSEVPLYKGFSEYWSFTNIIKAFDRIAPSPGVNWQGEVWQWLDSAQAAGWVIKKKPEEVMPGALVIRGNPVNGKVKVGIAREIKNNNVIIETCGANLLVEEEIISFEDINSDNNGFIFLGYIYPLRVN